MISLSVVRRRNAIKLLMSGVRWVSSERCTWRRLTAIETVLRADDSVLLLLMLMLLVPGVAALWTQRTLVLLVRRVDTGTSSLCTVERPTLRAPRTL